MYFNSVNSKTILYTGNRNLEISRAPLKSQTHQGTSLFTSAATNQRGGSIVQWVVDGNLSSDF